MSASRNQNACAAMKLAGSSPREIAKQREIAICVWLLRNGFAIELVISILFGTSKNDYCKRMVERGLLRATSIPPGWPINRDYYAKDYFTLSDAGLALALQYETELSSYPEIDPLKVRSSKFFHSILFQVETAWRLQKGGIAGYKSERMLPSGGKGEKIPDGAWLRIKTTDKWHLIEIENHDRKEAEKLGKFTTGILNHLTDENYEGAGIITHTDALIKHYQTAFLANAEYYKEWVEEKKRWYPKQSTKTVISKELAKRVTVIKFSSPSDIRAMQRKAVQKRVQEMLPLQAEFE